MVGRTIASDLAKHFDVTSMDISPKSLELLSKNTPNVVTREVDLTNYEHYEFYLNEFDLVVNAVPGFIGYKSLEHIIKAGKNCVDISFFPEALSPVCFTVERTLAACSPPMTEMREFGHIHKNLGE